MKDFELYSEESLNLSNLNTKEKSYSVLF